MELASKIIADELRNRVQLISTMEFELTIRLLKGCINNKTEPLLLKERFLL